MESTNQWIGGTGHAPIRDQPTEEDGMLSLSQIPVDRFWANVAKTDACWLWTGPLSGGYGRLLVSGKYVRAQRISYTLHHGLIPAGLSVLQTCHNRCCVHPDHLVLGSHNDSRDYTIRLAADRFWSKVDKSGECWIWTGYVASNGYGLFHADEHSIMAHRFAYQITNGPISDDLVVCHNCPDGDNRSCVNPAHLFLGTQADNMQDAKRKGRLNVGHPATRGEANHSSKLNAQAVLTIRHLFSTGTSKASLARSFGVSEHTIYSVVTRQTWKHI